MEIASVETLGKRRLPALSVELWESIFLHLDKEDCDQDKTAAFSALTVSKLLHNAMHGRALHHEVVITRAAQLPLLLLRLIRRPDLAKHIRNLSLVIDHNDLESMGTDDLTYSLAPLPYIVEMASHIRYLYLEFFLVSAEGHTLQAIMNLKHLRILSVDNIEPLHGLPENIESVDLVSIHQITKVCGVKRLIVQTYMFGEHDMQPYTHASLPDVEVLDIRLVHIVSDRFSRLVSALSPSLRYVKLSNIRGLRVDRFIEAVRENGCATEWLELELSGCFRVDEFPVAQFDYLKHLPALRKARFCQGTLGWNSLAFIGPNLSQITLAQSTLSQSQLAASIGFLRRATGKSRTIRFTMLYSKYSAADRQFLQDYCQPQEGDTVRIHVEYNTPPP